MLNRLSVIVLTCTTRYHARRVITDVNAVIRGWGQYFRAGNAATKFLQLDRYVEDRLRALLLHRAGSRLRAGRAEIRRRPFFEAMGLYRLRGTIQYPETA